MQFFGTNEIDDNMYYCVVLMRLTLELVATNPTFESGYGLIISLK